MTQFVSHKTRIFQTGHCIVPNPRSAVVKEDLGHKIFSLFFILSFFAIFIQLRFIPFHISLTAGGLFCWRKQRQFSTICILSSSKNNFQEFMSSYSTQITPTGVAHSRTVSSLDKMLSNNIYFPITFFAYIYFFMEYCFISDMSCFFHIPLKFTPPSTFGRV